LPPLEPPSPEELETCPFCEGREDRTPPELLALPSEGREPDTPGWRVRVVPNKYPAFEHQEVVVHSPDHRRSIAELDSEDFELVAEAWRLRAAAARDAGYPHTFAGINEGRSAGASLAHTHSQLVWLREEPPVPAGEHAAGKCLVCAYLVWEQDQRARVVEERDGLLLLCPYASRSPYECLVAPVEHEADGFGSERLAAGLALAGKALRRVHALEGPHAANLWLHGGGHWHLELLPRLTVFASIELGAGLYVNMLAPEEAALALRG
jgi:UDPglucose--hexose-1-phosphate uridylyltransferase